MNGGTLRVPPLNTGIHFQELKNFLINLDVQNFIQKIDLKSGYHQLQVKDEDIPKTVF